MARHGKQKAVSRGANGRPSAGDFALLWQSKHTLFPRGFKGSQVSNHNIYKMLFSDMSYDDMIYYSELAG